MVVVLTASARVIASMPAVTAAPAPEECVHQGLRATSPLTAACLAGLTAAQL